MSKLKTILLVLVSSVISSLITAVVVLYIDVKPKSNVFAEAGDVAFYGVEKEVSNEPVVVMTGKATFVSDNENVDETDAKDLSSDESQADTIEHDENTSESEFYMLTGRDKYHKSDCYYIRDKDNVVSVTMSEITDKGFEPCKKCLKK